MPSRTDWQETRIRRAHCIGVPAIVLAPVGEAIDFKAGEWVRPARAHGIAPGNRTLRFKRAQKTAARVMRAAVFIMQPRSDV